LIVVERQWVRHREHGGYFQCPVDVLDDMAAKGWEPSEAPPPPVNPAVAEQLAWRQQQAENEKTEPKTASRGETKE
jgi:hypothetical protein